MLTPNTEKLTTKSILEKYTGIEDVMQIDYTSLDNIEFSDIDLTGTRGSIRLIMGNILTEKEVDVMVEKYLSKPIP